MKFEPRRDPQALPPYDDLEAARALERSGARLFLYPGDAHLFADRSLADYDEASAALFLERVLAFL